jgi:hypothetical protein
LPSEWARENPDDIQTVLELIRERADEMDA